jgi:hypothetical protein
MSSVPVPRLRLVALLLAFACAFPLLRAAADTPAAAATPAPAPAATDAANGSSAPAPAPIISTGVRPDYSGSAALSQLASNASNALMNSPGLIGVGAAATDPAPPPTPPSPGPSSNVTINLIHLMVKRGLITKADSESLIEEAEQEAIIAQAQAQQAQTQSQAPAVAAAPSAPGDQESSATPGGPVPAVPSPAVPADGDEDVNVSYVPDVVRDQIRDDVKADVMKEARAENWGGTQVPDWVTRFHVTGDIRVRVEGDYFPSGNDTTGAFTNFNAINTGSPFNVSSIQNPNFPPEYNVDQTRYRPRLRARLGTEVDLGEGFTAGLRIATGQDDSPTTENQTLDVANQGQGGDFSKYAIWLDRAFIKYEFGSDPSRHVTLQIGRFDNPFLSSSMIWADDIGFDGVMANARYQVANGVTPFLTAGFFPVFNTDFNFASDQPEKFSSEDKWLYAAQLGSEWKINHDFTAKGAAALYYFENVEGRLSSPFVPLSTNDVGDTDDTRPSFAQNGNTYMELRDIVPTAANDYGTIDQYQYYGLATGFTGVALTGTLDFNRFDPFHMQLLGEIVDNLAFDQNSINAIAVNNRGAGGTGSFNGGNMGYNVRLTLGQPALQKLGDWNINLTYRYVESDATIDGFTDADFGGPLVGTNLKGYIIGGNLALAQRVWATLRFFSADSIAGPTYRSDLFQFDINAKF